MVDEQVNLVKVKRLGEMHEKADEIKVTKDGINKEPTLLTQYGPYL